MRVPLPIVRLIFFGNYFYGICAVALAVEATWQQQYPLNDWKCYAMIFFGTVIYYTIAYISEKPVNTSNARLNWYARHHNAIVTGQQIFIGLLAVLTLHFLYLHWSGILQLLWWEWLMAGIFPLVGAFYYGIGSGVFGAYNLRSIGWLKPFIIGFSWAGMVNIYPIMYYGITHNQVYHFTLVGVLLFIKNFMFISVLCIIFDIKDYADDANQRLKTFVTEVGLRKTIFYILIPLSLMGLGSFWIYGFFRHFSAMKILLNTIPFLLLLAVTYSMHRRRAILYYLIIIDGLMLVKAVCGSVAMVWF